jgi:hypothetical protein
MTAAISAIALLSVLSAGPKVVVFGFQGIGVDSVTAMVATSLFRTELGNTGKFAVATTDEVAGVLGADRVVSKVSDAQDAARRIGAAKAVIGSLSRLGTQTIGMVKLIDVAGGNVEFEDQLATTSQDELDIVLKRLARAVATKEKASAEVELGEITEKESKEVNRRQAFFGGGVGLGGFVPVGGLGTNEVMPMLGGFGLYETPDFFAEVRYTGSFGINSYMYGSASLAPITIGIFKTASRSDFTPYYGGALGIGAYSSIGQNSYPYGQDGWGFVVAPGVGYMLFHTYDFHVMADLRYYLVFGGGGVQHGPALNVNLAYRRSNGSGGCCLFGW